MNELKSAMVIQENTDHSFVGRYRSIAGPDPHIRDLCGRTHLSESGKQMLAFAVCFEVVDPGAGYGHISVCSWSGWMAKNAAGQRIIDTRWLLSRHPLDPKDEWSSRLIGEDRFERVDALPREELLGNLEGLQELFERTRS